MPHTPVSFIGISLVLQPKQLYTFFERVNAASDLQKSSLMIEYLAKMPNVHGAIYKLCISVFPLPCYQRGWSAQAVLGLTFAIAGVERLRHGSLC